MTGTQESNGATKKESNGTKKEKKEKMEGGALPTQTTGQDQSGIVFMNYEYIIIIVIQVPERRQLKLQSGKSRTITEEQKQRRRRVKDPRGKVITFVCMACYNMYLFCLPHCILYLRYSRIFSIKRTETERRSREEEERRRSEWSWHHF